jgi:hypothetical protein
MSVDQIEDQIRQLSRHDILRITKWLSEFLASQSENRVDEWQESTEQKVELERRLGEFLKNPSVAQPVEENYFADLKRQLADERSKKPFAR